MTKFDARFHPVNLQSVFGAVEHVVRHHLKRRQMATRATHSVNVRQSNARLGHRQRVRRGVDRTGGDMGLKICDGSDGEVDVITPPCQHGVGVNPGVILGLKKSEEGLSHGVLEGLSSLVKPGDEGSTDEGVLVLFGITARVSIGIGRPKPQRSHAALFPDVAVLVKDGEVDGRQGHQINSMR